MEAFEDGQDTALKASHPPTVSLPLSWPGRRTRARSWRAPAVLVEEDRFCLVRCSFRLVSWACPGRRNHGSEECSPSWWGALSMVGPLDSRTPPCHSPARSRGRRKATTRTWAGSAPGRRVVRAPPTGGGALHQHYWPPVSQAAPPSALAADDTVGPDSRAPGAGSILCVGWTIPHRLAVCWGPLRVPGGHGRTAPRYVPAPLGRRSPGGGAWT